MPYTLEWEPEVQQQTLGIPYEFVSEFAEALGGILEDPWNFQRRPTEPTGSHYAGRTISFGNGRGLVRFFILEHARQVHIMQITWLG